MLIKQYPIIFLLLSSLLLLSCSVSRNNSNQNDKVQPLVTITDLNAVKFKTTIKFNEAAITGILIVKNQNDTIKGAFINEFGIKAFGFDITPARCRVYDLAGNLDKWYIRKTLSSDLWFIFTAGSNEHSSGKNYSERFKNKQCTGKLIVEHSSITMENTRRGIRYQFERLP